MTTGNLEATNTFRDHTWRYTQIASLLYEAAGSQWKWQIYSITHSKSSNRLLDESSTQLHEHNPLRIRIDVASLPAWLLSGALAVLALGAGSTAPWHGPSISRNPRQIEGPSSSKLFGRPSPSTISVFILGAEAEAEF